MSTSPYMTRGEVAEYARCAPITVYRALVAFRQSQGARGLRGSQPGGVNGRLMFHRDDVERWMAGQAPSSSSARPVRRSA